MNYQPLDMNGSRFGELRERWNRMQFRKEREYAHRNGSYNGVALAGYPFRFTSFCCSIERSARIAGNFAVHTQRVEHALASPIARFVAEQSVLETLIEARIA